MNKDIRVTIGVADHPKTIRLIRMCGEGAFRCLLRLWCYAAEYRPSGALTAMDAMDIAIASGWEGDEAAWVEALKAVRFLDEADGVLILHDWAEHNAYAVHAEERSASARSAAKVRWAKRDATGRNADDMRPACGPHAIRNAPSPSPYPDSDPNGSSTPQRAEARFPDSPPEADPTDLKARLFGPALAWLAEHSGKSAKTLRPMVGRWCSRNGDGAVLEALTQAARASPVDPVGWIEGVLNGKARKNGTKPADDFDERIRRNREATLRVFGPDLDPGADHSGRLDEGWAGGGASCPDRLASAG